ncbi:MAG: hypothetical protein HY332_05265 [Chloroflexi bacterium]|nr:hypothetical protein [Chloroflexota bacterium]
MSLFDQEVAALRLAQELGGRPLNTLTGDAAGRLYAEAAGDGEFGYAIADEGGPELLARRLARAERDTVPCY